MILTDGHCISTKLVLASIPMPIDCLWTPRTPLTSRIPYERVQHIADAPGVPSEHENTHVSCFFLVRAVEFVEKRTRRILKAMPQSASSSRADQTGRNASTISLTCRDLLVANAFPSAAFEGV